MMRQHPKEEHIPRRRCYSMSLVGVVEVLLLVLNVEALELCYFIGYCLDVHSLPRCTPEIEQS